MKDALEYVVLDTNVVVHQVDFLEARDGIRNCIILQTVLDETRNVVRARGMLRAPAVA